MKPSAIYRLHTSRAFYTSQKLKMNFWITRVRLPFVELLTARMRLVAPMVCHFGNRTSLPNQEAWLVYALHFKTRKQITSKMKLRLFPWFWKITTVSSQHCNETSMPAIPANFPNSIMYPPDLVMYGTVLKLWLAVGVATLKYGDVKTWTKIQDQWLKHDTTLSKCTTVSTLYRSLNLLLLSFHY